MRGLKPASKGFGMILTKVASFTDAWIETCRSTQNTTQVIVASFTDAWIETTCIEEQFDGIFRRIFYRCVD